MPFSLSSQLLVPCSPGDKIKLALLSIATIDALGAPAEFKPRGTFPPIGVMRENSNFVTQGRNLPPGTWTHDTSLTLCLAHSLSTSSSAGALGYGSKGGFDENHQMDTYLSWKAKGFLSCTGEWFGVGNTIYTAFQIYEKDKSKAFERIDMELNRVDCRGNGSLMRVLPVGLAYWSLGEDKAAEFASLSSRTTHPDDMCCEACEIYTRMITWVMSHASAGLSFSKLDLLQRLSHLPIRNRGLRELLSIPVPPPDCFAVEEYYLQNHPLLKLSKRFPPRMNPETGLPTIPPEDGVPSSGYVLDTLRAALYAFFSTQSFDTGALLTVNMGDYAHTVGAVYAGLAATWYASNEDPRFWSMRMRNWTDDLRGTDVIKKVTDQLIKYERKVRSNSSTTKSIDV